MKPILAILISLLCYSCINNNYYPIVAFEFNDTQKALLSLYNTGDTISFSKDNLLNKFIIGDVSEQKNNSYTHFGINSKSFRSKDITFKRANNRNQYTLFSCYVAPRFNEREIYIHFLDGKGFYSRSSLLLNQIPKIQIKGLMFDNIFEIQAEFPERINPNEILTMYLSLTDGIIGYKMKNEDVWVNTKFL